jgi:hypothetical protein
MGDLCNHSARFSNALPIVKAIATIPTAEANKKPIRSKIITGIVWMAKVDRKLNATNPSERNKPIAKVRTQTCQPECI